MCVCVCVSYNWGQHLLRSFHHINAARWVNTTCLIQGGLTVVDFPLPHNFLTYKQIRFGGAKVSQTVTMKMTYQAILTHKNFILKMWMCWVKKIFLHVSMLCMVKLVYDVLCSWLYTCCVCIHGPGATRRDLAKMGWKGNFCCFVSYMHGPITNFSPGGWSKDVCHVKIQDGRHKQA